MLYLKALIYFLLALFGIEQGGSTVITRTRTDGVDVIHSRTRVMAGVARFECIASASGECHYVLIPRKCASAPGHCFDQPLDRLTIPAGGKREVVGLPAFDACVTQDDAAAQRECGKG